MVIKDIHEVKECPECASMNIVYNESKQQVICKDCGVIYQPLAPEDEEKFERVSGILKNTINKIKGIGKKKRKKKKKKQKKKKRKRK